MRTKSYFVKVIYKNNNKIKNIFNFEHMQFVNKFINNLDDTLYYCEVV